MREAKLMTHFGTVQGNRIELEEPINLPSGTRVRVLVLPEGKMDSHCLIGLRSSTVSQSRFLAV
jgi:hypothetical protein